MAVILTDKKLKILHINKAETEKKGIRVPLIASNQEFKKIIESLDVTKELQQKKADLVATNQQLKENRLRVAETNQLYLKTEKLLNETRADLEKIENEQKAAQVDKVKNPLTKDELLVATKISEIKSSLNDVVYEVVNRKYTYSGEEGKPEKNSVLNLYRNGYPHAAGKKAEELVKKIDGLMVEIKELGKSEHSKRYANDIERLQEFGNSIAAKLENIVLKQGKIEAQA